VEPDTPGTGLSGATCGGGVRGTISSLLFTNFLMGKIPEALNERMNADLFYTRCCIPGRRIERYHNLIFAGRQVNENWAILPFAKSVHDELPGNPALKELCDWIMTQRAKLRPYCKAIARVSTAASKRNTAATCLAWCLRTCEPTCKVYAAAGTGPGTARL
jgi:hypothetical protein